MNRPFRPRLACIACTRKKIRCDKLVPCGNCVKRGEAELCVRDTGNDDAAAAMDGVAAHREATPMMMMSVDAQQRMTRLMQNLMDRIEQLEARQLVRGGHQPERPSTALLQEDGNTCPLTEENHIANAPAVTPDSLAAADGVFTADVLPCTPSGSSASVRPAQSLLREESSLAQFRNNQLSFLQLLLPDRERVQRLVDYHTESLLWSHGGYHAPSFRQDLARFYDVHRGQLTAAGLDLQWLALLFAVISGAVISASGALVEQWGFRMEEQCQLSERWYDATLECLHLSQYLSHHQLYSLQAIVVLTTSAYMLGRMRSQNVLIATGIRIAQNLGLHQLGDEEADGLSEGLVSREIGRRVWYALTRQDYFFIPFAESYFVRPVFNRTEKPRNCRDEDMVSLPDSVPTVMSYCRFMDKIAELMPELHDAFNASTTVYAGYEEIIQFDAKMRTLATVHRPPFFTECSIDQSWPKYVTWARRALTISFAHKVIMIHRKMLARSMTDPVFSFTRKTCVAASKTILKTLRQPGDMHRPILWIEQAFTVTAGVILCFDMLYRSHLDSDSPQHQLRMLVEEAVHNLRQVDQSIIARKGARLLSALLQEERHGPARSDSIRGKRKFDEIDTNASWHESASQFVDVEAFVHGFWRRQREKNRDNAVPSAAATAGVGYCLPIPQTPSPSSSRASNPSLESEDIQGFLLELGLYGSTSAGAMNSEEPAATMHAWSEQAPSFEDLLFRAENFDF